DTLHLNDVETFPSSRAPGTFAPGDVMISLRDINGIIVFDPKTKRIKYRSVGQILRQHDPDFIDGNTISVFDNNTLEVLEKDSEIKDRNSRIVTLSAVDDSIEVRFTGSHHQPFFTRIMGKHQWLPNGNLLITEARRGRVFEVDTRGAIIWEYFNIVENNVLGQIDEGQRLAPQFNRAFFEQKGGACPAPS
ncbi:MAG: arylsulfotransferase family protein, partial [Arenimonas sp.]